MFGHHVAWSVDEAAVGLADCGSSKTSMALAVVWVSFLTCLAYNGQKHWQVKETTQLKALPWALPGLHLQPCALPPKNGPSQRNYEEHMPILAGHIWSLTKKFAVKSFAKISLYWLEVPKKGEPWARCSAAGPGQPPKGKNLNTTQAELTKKHASWSSFDHFFS